MAEYVGDVAIAYDRDSGHVLFEQYASDIARRVAERSVRDVLEVASGTGIVTRKLRNVLPKDAQLTAIDISDSMMETAQVEKVIYPIDKERLVRIPNAYSLQSRASVDWSGPIYEITDKIAQAAHYRLRVMGKEPAVPVLISIHAKDQSLGEILRNIDYQAGKRAYLYVYPNSQLVELRYAKIYN